MVDVCVVCRKLPFLVQQYLSCLKDYLVVSTQSARNVKALVGYYFDGRVVSGARGAYELDWQSVLRAAACALPHVQLLKLPDKLDKKSKEKGESWISAAVLLLCVVWYRL
jgi:hypothetical protein